MRIKIAKLMLRVLNWSVKDVELSKIELLQYTELRSELLEVTETSSKYSIYFRILVISVIALQKCSTISSIATDNSVFVLSK